MIQRIGGYEVLGRLGAGGMGEVLRVRDEHGRELALKLPSGRLNPRQLERFQREGELTARLRHPGIVTVHGSGTHEGRPYLVYELVEGVELGKQLSQLDRDQRLEVLASVAEALGHAHREGVIHRDLKASNILLGADGRPRVMDFGLARAQDLDRLTRSGTILGTPYTMAPEQVTSDRGAQGPHTDVWALGVLLYEMLTDRRPFRGTSSEMLTRILCMDPRPLAQLDPTVPPALERVCLRALAKAPGARYPHADAFADALREARHGRESPARARRAWAAPLLTCLVLGAGVAAAWESRAQPAPSSPRPPRPAAVPAQPKLDLAARWEEALQAEQSGRADALPALAVSVPPGLVPALQGRLLAAGLARVQGGQQATAPLAAVLAALARQPLPVGDEAGGPLADALLARVAALFQEEDHGLQRGLDLLEQAAPTGIRVQNERAAYEVTDLAFLDRSFDTITRRDYWRFLVAAARLDVPLANKHVSDQANVSLEDRPRLRGAGAAWVDYLTERYRSSGPESVAHTALRVLVRLIRDPEPAVRLGPLHWAEVSNLTAFLVPGAERQALLNEASRRAPQDPWVWLARSSWELQQGQLAQAKEDGERGGGLYERLKYAQVTSLTFTRVELHAQLLRLEAHVGDRQRARAAYRVLRREDPPTADQLLEELPWLAEPAR